MHERHLRAMGSDCHLLVVGPAATVDLMTARLEELEARWSRFRPDSDVSAVAAADGLPVAVHPDTVLLVQRMVAAHQRTDGWYDPTMAVELRRLGYDRDFALLPPAGDLPAAPAGDPSAAPAGAPRVAADQPRAPVPIVLEGTTVRVPADHGLDPGSIGKGLAADVLVDLATAHGAAGVLVNLGGDVRARGLDEDGAPWGVVVADDPVHGAPTDAGWDRSGGVVLGLDDGAVATSTVMRRRWALPHGGTAQHVLDPRTGASTTHDLHTVTVAAEEGWWADAAATAVLTAGPAGPGLAIGLELCCRLTYADGTRLELGGWDAAVSRP